MPSHASTSTIDSDLYSTSFSQAITEYLKPTCPQSSVQDPQLYDIQSGKCVSIPASALNPVGPTDPGCGGAPFKVKVDGQCYSTNDCPISPSLSSSCLNSQHIKYQKPPLAGPGVLAGMRYM